MLRGISKLRKLLKRTFSSICSKLQKNIKQIIYSIVFICGAGLITLSFFVKDNWINVCSGVGTGLLTSLVVSVIINAESNAREKRKKEEEKRFVLNNIIESSIDVYEDVIHRINEFITLTEMVHKPVYKLYDDFTIYNHFEEQLKAIDIADASDEMKKRLKVLFSFDNYRIDHLIAELKRLTKQEYFLRGILTQEECNNLISNYAKDSYLEYAAHIQDFLDNDIKNKDKCIRFLRMTTYICSKTISCFLYSRKKAEEKEEFIQKRMDQLYYDEVYCKSDQYIEQQIRKSEEEAEYFAEYPEELERLERQFEDWIKETPEDRVLEDLYYCICGLSAYSVDELLAQLDIKSEKVITFFKTEEIQKSLKKKRKLRKAIVNKFGKDYLNKILVIHRKIS